MQRKEFLFHELDGYYNMMVNYGKGGQSYDAIGIVKDKEIILKIDSGFCSNLDELRLAIKDLHYLGINIDWQKQNF